MTVLVTGGGGFLGLAVVRRLIKAGHQVRSFSRGSYPELLKLGCTQYRGDLSDAASLTPAVRGCDAIVHTAGKVGLWGAPGEFEKTNVLGTKILLEQARREGVSRMVFTSSPSVVFNGQDMEGVDESTPYPAHYEAEYPRTKAAAEKLVLAANGPSLATVALRPHLIWGPGDTSVYQRLVARAKAGRLRQVGPRTNRVDVTYVEHAAEAHHLALQRLAPGSAIAGKAYFLSDDHPVNLWEMVDLLLDTAGMPPLRRRAPVWLAVGAGAFFERLWTLLGRTDEPPITRFMARELATSHWYDISAAKRDLDYRPFVGRAEGLEQLRQWVQRGGLASIGIGVSQSRRA